MPNNLYLNQGEMKFRDVSAISGGEICRPFQMTGKSLVQLMVAGKEMLDIAGENRDSLRVFGHQKTWNNDGPFFPEPDDFAL